MAGSQNEDRHRKSLDSIRDVLSRLETMADTNQKLAEADDSQPEQVAATNRKTQDSDVVTPLSIRRRPNIGLITSSTTELNSKENADGEKSQKASTRSGDDRLDQRDIGKLRPSEFDLVSPLKLDPANAHKAVKNSAAGMGLLGLGFCLAIAGAVYWFLVLRMDYQRIAQEPNAVRQVLVTPAATIPMKSEVVSVPSPVLAQRPAPVSTPEPTHGNSQVAPLADGEKLTDLKTSTNSMAVTAPTVTRSTTLTRRGVEALANGDGAGARQSFQEAAERGEADAAFYLAMTFDPQFFSRLGVKDLTPDAEVARRWYKVAASNGSADAVNRLKQLDNK